VLILLRELRTKSVSVMMVGVVHLACIVDLSCLDSGARLHMIGVRMCAVLGASQDPIFGLVKHRKAASSL
jgi:hypothetical protein